MYLIPLAVIVILALVAVAWSPIFALVIFALFFAGFLAYVGFSRRADQSRAAPMARGAERGPHDPSDSSLGS